MAGELGARRALVVSDPGIVAAGHADARARLRLRGAGIETQLFDGVAENPTTDNVEAGLAVARRHEPELIVGLGGGSSMDCAKGINFLYSNGGRMQDYWGVGKATRPMLPMIAVPTTAGTGSETQSFALISDAKTHVKMACGDKKASFRVALLDPELTVTQPRARHGADRHRRHRACAGNVRHQACAIRCRWRSAARPGCCWARISPACSTIPNDLEARGGMQLGACFAGLAIENSMLGATHALANPLTTHYGIAHGQAIGLMLPHVIRFNGAECGDWYRELLEGTGGANGFPRSGQRRRGAGRFRRRTGSPGRAGRAGCAECGVERSQAAELAAEAAKQWTGGFNPA